jgi:ATP-dependent DNA helicase RecQ
MIEQSEGTDAHRRNLSAHLDAMLGLCETVECRRSRLLAYFGETSGPCGNCDTCLSPPEAWDGTIPAQKLLSTVVRLWRERQQRFGAGHIIDILIGKTTPRVSQQGHDSVATFGIGQDVTEQEWRGVVRQLLAQDLLAINRDGFGTLVITEGSARVLDGSHRVMLRREAPKRSKAAKRAVAAQLPGEALELFEALREWRAREAREQNVPAYVVFGDATLRGVATLRPSTLDELAEISGIGEKKLEQYGGALLAVVASA